MRSPRRWSRWAGLGVLGLAIAGCAPALTPAAVDRTLDGWAAFVRDGAGVSVLAGSTSARLCEDIRRAMVRIDEPFPVRCQRVRFDVNPRFPNFHVAIGSQLDDGALVFLGGPTEGDCERLRLGARQYRWSAVPCRPVVLIER